MKNTGMGLTRRWVQSVTLRFGDLAVFAAEPGAARSGDRSSTGHGHRLPLRRTDGPADERLACCRPTRIRAYSEFGFGSHAPRESSRGAGCKRRKYSSQIARHRVCSSRRGW